MSFVMDTMIRTLKLWIFCAVLLSIESETMCAVLARVLVMESETTCDMIRDANSTEIDYQMLGKYVMMLYEWYSPTTAQKLASNLDSR